MTQPKQSLDIKEILDVIPHRYPFLLIDKILNVDTDAGTIEAQKNVTFNEEFFQGHFPGAPIMPGVLIIEAMAQAGGVLIYLKDIRENPLIAVLMNIKNAKFRLQVKPGDALVIKCEGIHFSSKGGKIQGVAYVEDKIACQAEMSFCLVDRENV